MARHSGTPVVKMSSSYPDAPVLVSRDEQGIVTLCMNRPRFNTLELEMLGNINRHREALSVALEKRARLRLEKGMAKGALMDLARAIKASPWRAGPSTG